MITLTQNQPAFNFLNTLVSKLRMTDQLISKNEFVFQKEQKEAKQAEMLMAKKTLLAGNAEKVKRTDELIVAYNQSNKGEEFLKEYVHGLEEMMFMTHHKVRQPVANILGMANLIDQYTSSPAEMKKIVGYMKQSALDLDAFTRELTAFISNLEKKGKNKS